MCNIFHKSFCADLLLTKAFQIIRNITATNGVVPWCLQVHLPNCTKFETNSYPWSQYSLSFTVRFTCSCEYSFPLKFPNHTSCPSLASRKAKELFPELIKLEQVHATPCRKKTGSFLALGGNSLLGIRNIVNM